MVSERHPSQDAINPSPFLYCSLGTSFHLLGYGSLLSSRSAPHLVNEVNNRPPPTPLYPPYHPFTIPYHTIYNHLTHPMYKEAVNRLILLLLHYFLPYIPYSLLPFIIFITLTIIYLTNIKIHYIPPRYGVPIHMGTSSAVNLLPTLHLATLTTNESLSPPLPRIVEKDSKVI